MKRLSKVMIAGVVAYGAGCATTEPTPPAAGNQKLGIANFQVNDTPERTTVIGLDVDNKEIAKLDLVHGKFTLTVEDSPMVGQVVDGRKLKIEVLGKEMSWETIGYSDTTQMPAMPHSADAIAIFVEDPHVQPILQQWSIGWKPAALPRVLESEYFCSNGVWYWSSECDAQGTNPTDCSGTQGGTINCPIMGGTGSTRACGQGPAQSANVLTETSPYYSANENTVSMCCGADNWYTTRAMKTCAASGTSSSCGNVGQACAPCGGYPFDNEGCSAGLSYGDPISYSCYPRAHCNP